jgi:hypothetical protein
MNPPRNPIFGRGVEPDRPTKQAIDRISGRVLAIFSFGAGGGIEANIRRWISQFQPEGRKLRITSGKSPQGSYFLVDLRGTYNKPVGPPFQRKTEPAPGTRMLSVILVIEEKGVYFLKLVGPQETVSGQVAAIRASFGGNADQEKEYKMDDDPGDS